MKKMTNKKTGREMIPQPRELWDAIICNGATADGERIKIKGDDGKIEIITHYYIERAGTVEELGVADDYAEKYNIPRTGYRPDLRNACRVGQFLAMELTHFGYINTGAPIELDYTADNVVKALNGGAPVSKDRKAFLLDEFESGLMTLHFLTFATKEVTGFGVGAWYRDKHGNFEITLTTRFIEIFIKTRRADYYPELLELGARDEFIYKLAAVLIEATANGTTYGVSAVKKIFTRLNINLDTIASDTRGDQKNRLESALDKLINLKILKEWRYTEPRSTTKIPRESIKPARWAGLLLRWEIK